MFRTLFILTFLFWLIFAYAVYLEMVNQGLVDMTRTTIVIIAFILVWIIPFLLIVALISWLIKPFVVKED